MADIIALCMKCRVMDDEKGKKVPTKKAMKNPSVEQNEKGRWSARGECPDCGTKMFKFMSEADALANGGVAK